MATTESVTTTATRLLEASSRASGTSSEKTIQIMAPAAKPSPYGTSSLNTSTKRKAGTANKGCGRLEKMLHSAARTHPTPPGLLFRCRGTQRACRSAPQHNRDPAAATRRHAHPLLVMCPSGFPRAEYQAEENLRPTGIRSRTSSRFLRRCRKGTAPSLRIHGRRGRPRL